MTLFWLRLAVLLYGVAALAVLPAALYDRARWSLLAVPATVAAAMFHFVSLAETLNAAHHRLPVEAHEVQSVLALVLAVVFLGVYARYRSVSLGVFVLPIVFLLAILAAFRPGQENFPMPAKTGWLVLHITLLMAAYAALLVSLSASILYLVQERRLKSRTKGKIGGAGSWLKPFDTPLETIDQIAQKTLLFGLPCMTAGLLIGSVMALEEHGPVYFSDPKIVLTFGLWAAYVAMIFLRRSSGLRGRRAAYLSGFVVMVVLFVWAANQFSAVHRFQTP
ncbi:MAG TPA: cytochrome c biogenesis protein CcsA [Acidobacteriaceae bacterium]|nr:cytochrome c biogenesis protein CcsA [Acidobacteriaceae bacterium]